MLKLHDKAFAIRYKSGNKQDQESLYDFFRLVADQYPDMKIEGVNYARRPEEAIKAIARLGNILIAQTSGKKKKGTNKDVICIGVGDKFDISFEQSKNLKVGGFYPLIPIYHIRDNAVDIVEGLDSYLRDQFPLTHTMNKLSATKKAADGVQNIVVVQTAKPRPVVKEYSTHVMVGTKCMSWDEYYRWEHEFSAKEKSVEVHSQPQCTLESALLGGALVSF